MPDLQPRPGSIVIGKAAEPLPASASSSVQWVGCSSETESSWPAGVLSLDGGLRPSPRTGGASPLKVKAMRLAGSSASPSGQTTEEQIPGVQPTPAHVPCVHAHGAALNAAGGQSELCRLWGKQ